VTDSRYVNGDLVNVNKDKIIVRDKDGNIFSIDKTDPRWLSG